VVAQPSDLDDRIAATARRLSGRSVGVVLSGGGARAFAHLGVLEELKVAGVRVDRIGAVSLGAIVGAAIACDFDDEQISDGLRAGFAETNPSGDFTLPLFSLVRGRRARSLLDQYFGGRRIEELPKRFFCVSCDLISHESVVHRTGPLSDAVYASLAIPGVFAPIPTADGRLLVDGGVLDNLPVATMARSAEGPVIAVDVSGRTGSFKRPARPGVARLATPMRRFLTGSDAEVPRLGETVVRTVTVGSIDTVAAARRHADLVIQPRVEGIGLLDWRQLDAARVAGREAARTALAGAPASVFG
jgi:predicted acylesterase/phospholipase RssA